MSLNYLATRFTCSWPWSTLIMLCDGRIVCGCSDPYAKRVLGDARTDTIANIWTGETASTLRKDLNAGGSSFCGDCPLKLPLEADDVPPQRPLDVGLRPTRLYVECTAACNLSCFQACCAPETGITKTRQAGMLDFDLFRRVLDEAGPTLGRIDFFNYGEAFLHKRAVEMCEYVKTHHPHIYLYTSTNGLAFSEEAVRRLIRSGIDEVTFSIDGARPESYVKYRQRGDFKKVLKHLSAAIDEKRKHHLDVPMINWRYILFAWNDSDAEMLEARRLAEQIGVDRLCWEITDHPEDSFSRRFAPGTDGHRTIANEIWDQSGLGNAIPGFTPRARIELRGLGYDEPVRAAAGQPVQIDTRVRNLSKRPFKATASYGRRLVRLGAQLCQPDGRYIDRDYARAWLPQDVPGGGRVDVPLALHAPTTPGEYLLRLDLVSEGVDWFEASGSEPTIRPLVVI